MHAIRHRITPENVARIAGALDRAGVDAIEVTHGDGLAGHSLTYGPGSNTDWEWIEAAAAVVHRAKLTTLLLPGVGTVKELERAFKMGVTSVRVATHCTEADVSAQHIAKARELGMDVSGFLMMSHLAEPAALAEQAKLMESYGAHCVYVTDSGGRLTMDGVRQRVRAYRDVLDAEHPDRYSRAPEPVAVGGQFGGGGRRRCDPRGRIARRTRCRCRQLPDRTLHRCRRYRGLEARL